MLSVRPFVCRRCQNALQTSRASQALASSRNELRRSSARRLTTVSRLERESAAIQSSSRRKLDNTLSIRPSGRRLIHATGTAPSTDKPHDRTNGDHDGESASNGSRLAFDPLKAALKNMSHEEVAEAAREAFGDALPKDILNPEQLRAYERLYGVPTELKVQAEEDPNGTQTLYRDSAQGMVEIGQMQYTTRSMGQGETAKANVPSPEEDVRFSMDPSEKNEEDSEVVFDEFYEDEEEGAEPSRAEFLNNLPEEEWPGDEDIVREHPLTAAGKFGTFPSTIFLPKTFTGPIAESTSHMRLKHLREAAGRTFGANGLPYSPSTPRSALNLEQKPVALQVTDKEMTDKQATVFLAAHFPQAYSAVTSALVEVRKRLGTEWIRDLLDKEGGPRVLDAGGGGSAIMAWRDILKAEWESMNPDTDPAAMPEEKLGRGAVICASPALKNATRKFLNNTSFLPRISNVDVERKTGNPSQVYDVIVVPYLLWSLERNDIRRFYTETFWRMLNPNGGVLVLLEKGSPRGFEVIAGARDFLLDYHIASPGAEAHIPRHSNGALGQPKPKETGMIVAPCTNHQGCPMYPTAGVALHRKDRCYFRQRYVRPPVLQGILGSKARNHDDVEFSYVAVMRGRDHRKPEHDPRGVGFEQGDAATEAAWYGHHLGVDPRDPSAGATVADVPAPHPLTLPRLILPPLKPKGHILLDVCTPSGTAERWVVARSQARSRIGADAAGAERAAGVQAYRDARKAQWGDLWALGAKTRTGKNLKLGETVREKGRRTGQRVEERGRDVGARRERRRGKKVEREERRVVEEMGMF